MNDNSAGQLLLLICCYGAIGILLLGGITLAVILWPKAKATSSTPQPRPSASQETLSAEALPLPSSSPPSYPSSQLAEPIGLLPEISEEGKGHPVGKPMFCSQCGSSILESAKFCSQCGTPVGGQNRRISREKHEMKEVRIDFRDVFGFYPILFQTTEHNTIQATYRWEPQDFDYERINSTLLNEVNKWMSDGWELVEDDLQKTLITQAEWVKNPLRSLLLGTGLDTFLPDRHTTKYTYIGATFHVRR